MKCQSVKDDIWNLKATLINSETEEWEKTTNCSDKFILRVYRDIF